MSSVASPHGWLCAKKVAVDLERVRDITRADREAERRVAGDLECMARQSLLLVGLQRIVDVGESRGIDPSELEPFLSIEPSLVKLSDDAVCKDDRDARADLLDGGGSE